MLISERHGIIMSTLVFQGNFTPRISDISVVSADRVERQIVSKRHSCCCRSTHRMNKCWAYGQPGRGGARGGGGRGGGGGGYLTNAKQLVYLVTCSFSSYDVEDIVKKTVPREPAVDT